VEWKGGSSGRGLKDREEKQYSLSCHKTTRNKIIAEKPLSLFL